MVLLLNLSSRGRSVYYDIGKKPETTLPETELQNISKYL